jgi:hypothetical protein
MGSKRIRLDRADTSTNIVLANRRLCTASSRWLKVRATAQPRKAKDAKGVERASRIVGRGTTDHGPPGQQLLLSLPPPPSFGPFGWWVPGGSELRGAVRMSR